MYTYTFERVDVRTFSERKLQRNLVHERIRLQGSHQLPTQITHPPTHTHTHTHAYIHACAPGSAVAAAAVPLLRLWLAAAEHVRHAVHPLTSAGQVS